MSYPEGLYAHPVVLTDKDKYNIDCVLNHMLYLIENFNKKCEEELVHEVRGVSKE